jgi:hypothetical protein
MTRTRIGLVLAVGVLGLVGLAACGRDAGVASPAEMVSDSASSAEVQALTSVGFDTTGALVTDPAPDASTAPDTKATPGAGGAAGARASKGPRARIGAGRRFLRKNTLHGEVVVKTKDGVKTVDVQRGTVTAIDARTVTVKSTDGFTLTWTFGNPIHVLDHRTSIQPSAVKVGTEIGVAGTKDGSTTTAHLVVVRSS